MDHQEIEQRHSEDQQIPAAPMAVPARNSYPPGYRFMPTDSELIVEYLQKKINNEPLPIAEINETYLKHVNPMDLTVKFPKLGDNEWYFFTPRDRKYPNGERPDRGSDSGYWKATGADKPVNVGDVTVGFRKALVFYEGKPQKGEKTNWIMHEFRVNAAARKKRTADDMRLDDWVLCRLYAKSSKLKNNRKNRYAKEQTDGNCESLVQASSGDHCESSEAAAALVTNQEMVENHSIFPENPYPFNYYPEQDMINTGFEDCSLQDLLQESDPALSDAYFQSYGIVGPVDEQVINNPFVINPYLNEEPFGFQQQQPFAGWENVVSSSWSSNEAFLPSSSVPANINININTNTNMIDAQQLPQTLHYHHQTPAKIKKGVSEFMKKS